MHTEHYRETDRMGDYTNESVEIADEGDFTCKCGVIIAEENIEELAPTCSHCDKRSCLECYKDAEKELGGGVNIEGSKFNICFDCSDEGAERILETLKMEG